MFTNKKNYVCGVMVMFMTLVIGCGPQFKNNHNVLIQLLAPMPHIPIMPTGGVTVENAAEWLANGAVCLGVGSSLMNKKQIEERDFEGITAIARAMTEAIKN